MTTHFLSKIFFRYLWVVLLTFIQPSCQCNKKRQHPNSATPLLDGTKRKIFILNGLWQSGHSFNTTMQHLSQSLQKDGLTVEVCMLQEPKTSQYAITKQALDTFETIQSRLQDNPTCEIILVGHSQGGLRAAKILTLNEQAGRPLNIKGLITLGTPWHGAPVAGINKESVASFLHEMPNKYMIKGMNALFPSSIQLTSDLFIALFFGAYFPMDDPGVQDMIPGSPFLKELASDMQRVASIPILAIGGNNGNIWQFLHDSPVPTILPKPYRNYLSKLCAIPTSILNSTYARIFAGGWHVQSDLVVPVPSQLGANMPYPFERYLIPDAVHDFIPFLYIPPNLVVYNHPAASKKIVAFVEKHFQQP